MFFLKQMFLFNPKHQNDGDDQKKEVSGIYKPSRRFSDGICHKSNIRPPPLIFLWYCDD
jgi:hypothetical protein